MTIVSHMLYCILSQFKTLHVLITQRLNSLVTIYIYSLFQNTETERTYVYLCVMNRETDGRKLPVITLGLSDRAQTPTQNISYIYIHTWCQKRASIWNDAFSTKMRCWKATNHCVSITLHHRFSDFSPPPLLLAYFMVSGLPTAVKSWHDCSRNYK